LQRRSAERVKIDGRHPAAQNQQLARGRAGLDAPDKRYRAHRRRNAASEEVGAVAALAGLPLFNGRHRRAGNVHRRGARHSDVRQRHQDGGCDVTGCRCRRRTVYDTIEWRSAVWISTERRRWRPARRQQSAYSIIICYCVTLFVCVRALQHHQTAVV